MYDTVNFWMYSCSVAEGNSFAVLQYLDGCKETVQDGALLGGWGKIGDYKVNVNQFGVRLSGSLCKHLLPSNLYTLSRSATKEAIEKLSDQLHIDMREAIVTRLDVSTVLPMSHPPKDYYSRLGNKPYTDRVQATASTLYYNSKMKQQIFYDKTKEATAKGAIIPPSLIDSNLLRYELRYTQRLKSQLKATSTVTASQLYEEGFYYSLIKNWRDEFYKINKINKHFDMNNIKTPKEAKDRLFAILLQDAGDHIVNEFIGELKGNVIFKDPKYYSRLKSDLNKIIQSPSEQKDELLNELEQAVNNASKYAR